MTTVTDARWSGMRKVLAALVAPALAVLVLTVPASPVAADGELPPYPTSPEGDPPGANDWKCEPTAKRPHPVILVHGTFGDRKHLLEGLSRSIKDKGFCVFSLDYGNRGTNDIKQSAKELKAYTQRVLRATGARKVSMVGHSQGGMMPRQFIKFLGGTKLVDDLVGVAPSNHGTDITGPGGNPISDLVGAGCRACNQQAAGSPFLRRLNRGDETPEQVSYTQITTNIDEVVVPHTSGYLEPGPRTTNVTIQDKCPLAAPAEHLLVPTSRTTIQIALDALTRPGPARKAFQPAC